MINRQFILFILILAFALLLFPPALSTALRATGEGERPAALASCTPTVVYVPIVLQSSGYTAHEAALRAAARIGYVVRRVRYAKSVRQGIAAGRYAEPN